VNVVYVTRRSGAAVTALAALALYALSLRNGFAYDDVPLILLDARVHSLRNLRDILFGPYWPVGGEELAIWRPLTTLSFAVDWALSDGRAAWFHATNTALNAAACVLVFLLLCEFFTPAAALVGALLFTVHPVHVEAVANVVGRAEMLAGIPMLAACLLWARRPAAETRPTRLITLATAALFAVALLAKESAAMLPLLLLLIDTARGRWRLERGSVVAYVRAILPALLAFLAVLVAYATARAAALGGLVPARAHPAAAVLESRAELILTALQAWPVYLRLLLFPRTLLIDYGPRIIMPATAWTGPAVAGLVILTGLVVGGVVAHLRGNGRAALALLWFPVAILPVSNLLVTIGVLVAERTLYVPSFALAVAGAGAAAVLGRLASRAGRGAALVLGVVGLVLLGARSAVRVPEWESTERIFAALARDRPDSSRAHWVLARAARQAGDRDAAREHFARAVQLWPYRDLLVVEAAAFALEEGRLAEGRELAAFGVERWPRNLALQRLLAAASLDLGDTAAARASIEAGLRLDPADPMLNQMRAALTAAGPGEGGER